MKYIFGREGYDYIRSELKRSTCRSGIGSRLEQLPLETGTVFAHLPMAPPGYLLASYGFDVINHSLLFYCDKKSSPCDYDYHDADLRFLSAWIESQSPHMTMFQTPSFRFKGDWKGTSLAPGEHLMICECEEGVEGWTYMNEGRSGYYGIDIVRARGTTPFPPGVGLLSSCPRELDLNIPIQRLTQDQMDELVANTEYLLIEAFDNEALLIYELGLAGSGGRP